MRGADSERLNGMTTSRLDTTIPYYHNRSMTEWVAPPGHRSGFIALAGRPNVGKSTLLNAYLKQHVAAVSFKPQTTRQRQLGILTRPQSQMIFVDTPGIHNPLHKLGSYMNGVALDAIRDADHILAIFDISEPPNQEDRNLVDNIIQISPDLPITMALNKCDNLEGEDLNIRESLYTALLPGRKYFRISALEGTNLDALLQAIDVELPEGPQFFPDDLVTTTYERDIAADMIRAVCLHNLREEVPYSLAVRIDEYTERNKHGAYIEATIFVERESQKGIVIGKAGQMIKTIGSQARADIEAATGRKVFLKIKVKVMPGWRNNEDALRKLGFT